MFLADTDNLMYNLNLQMFLKNSKKIICYLTSSIIIKKLKYYIGVNNLLVYITKHGTCNFITEEDHESKKAKGIKIMLSVMN